MSSASGVRSSMLPLGKAIGNITCELAEHAAAFVGSPGIDKLGLAERRMTEAWKLADLANADGLQSNRPGSPPLAADQLNPALKKMSAAITCPVTSSCSNVVAPSVWSRSGRFQS